MDTGRRGVCYKSGNIRSLCRSSSRSQEYILRKVYRGTSTQIRNWSKLSQRACIQRRKL